MTPPVSTTSPQRISVALCTYNGSAYLKAQLDSLARQTRLPDELVICDDQSTDATARIVGDFAHSAPFPVSFNINPQRLGVTSNFQRAFALCQSPLIAPCDQDDLWLPDKLQALARPFHEQPDLQLAFGNVAIMTPDGQDTGKTQWQELGFTTEKIAAFNNGESLATLLRYNVATGMAMMFRTALLQQALPLPESFIHDEWLSLLAAANGQAIAVDQVLVRYRQHASQKIGPANRSFIKQWRHARHNMGDPYIRQQLARTQALHERLAQATPSENLSQAIKLVDEKLDHLRRRLELRSRWWRRGPGATREMVQGNYRRFGYGWKSWAQDMLL